MVRIQDQLVPVRKKDKDHEIQETWMKRDIVNFVRKKKEAYARFRMLKLDRGD